MGAYLSSPVTEKISSNGKCDMFVYGASSMQGWRMSQEDAHNCLVDFDKETETSLFAVYDGHGGAEVAQYTADRFPCFLKSSEHYLNSDLQKALEEGFLDFDGTLVGESVIQELKQIAGLDDDEGEDEVCMPAGVGRNEADVLRAEANMPLEELLEKYENYTGVPLSVRSVKKKEQILSPVIKPKRPPVRQQEAVEADSNSNSISDVTTSNSSDDAMSSMCSFDQKMANGCADNENNLNFEKEFMEKNKTECLELDDKECIETVTASCDTDNHKTGMKPSVSSSSDSKNTSEDSCDVKSSEEHVSSSSSIKSPSSHSKDLCDTSCHSDSINTNSNAATDSSVTKCEQTPSSSSGSDQISENNNKLPNSSSELKTNGHSKSTDSEVLKEASEAEAMCCSSDNTCENISEAGPSCSSLSDHSCSSALKQNGTDAVSTDDSEAGPSCSSESRPYGGSDSKPDISEAESSVPGPSSSSKCIEETESSCGSSTNQSAACSSQEEAAGPSGSGASEHIKPTQSVEDDSDESVDDEDDDYEDSDEYIEESDDDDEEEEEDDEDDGVVDEMDGVQENLYRTDDPGFDSGCTAVVALLRNNQLIVANAGDSRCVLSRGGKAVDLSVDHKPEDDEEQKRIEAAGGNVTPEGRVNGGLNLSRAIGDHCYKQNTKKSPREQMITALPDIESCTLNDTDEFVIIACDGIWNYMSSQEVVDYVRERLKDPEKRDNPALICEELFDHCLAPNTTGDGTGCDNMTCIILAFHKNLESNLFDTLKRKANDPEMSEDPENNPEKKTKLSDS